MADNTDDLVASKTEGFRIGEKKTISEYTQLDANDESLNRWKASLGLNAGEPIGDPSDPRKCIIKSLTLQVEGRSDVVVDLSGAGAVEHLKEKPFTIKEGATFRIKVAFEVHHEVLSGLKYLQVVRRKGIRVSKDEEMLGSYAPNTTEKRLYEKQC
ncbi:rho-gdp dissociation inhibitor, partial [Aspergillus ochraceoroseus]